MANATTLIDPTTVLDTVAVFDDDSAPASETESDVSSETDSEYDEGSDPDDENHSIIRAKWQMDGATTLDECVTKLLNFIEYIKALKEEGWELQHQVDDDYGFIRRDQPQPVTASD